MKKQLLAAAVAATMTSVAMADISLTGAMKVNYTNTDSATEAADTNAINHDLDFTLVGKSGDTTVSATFSTTSKTGTGTVSVTSDAISDTSATAAETTAETTGTNGGLVTENVFLQTKIGDVTVKTGSWAGADSLLTNGSRADGKFEASMPLGPVTIKYADTEGSTGEAVTLSGEFQGVALSHEMKNNGSGEDTTDTSVSATVAGVTAAYRVIEVDGANNDKESLQISGDLGGVTATYAMFDTEGTGTSVSSDGYLGEISAYKADGFGIKTSLAGNTVQVKKISAKLASMTAADTDYTKVVVTRPLASGATFEATYTDTDNISGVADTKVLDLELAVKF